jgi:cell division protein FtsB
LRLVSVALLLLLVLVHAELWFGSGGLPHVMGLEAQLAAQRDANERARAANDRLAAEVIDLKEGREMVEEKARRELGMVKPDEILIQVSPAAGASAAATAPARTPALSPARPPAPAPAPASR